MSERSVTPATFVIERHYDLPPARVFAAWSDPAAKRRWFGEADGWSTEQHDLEFRVGGREVFRGAPQGGATYTFDGRYQDIVTDQRIIYAYTMDEDDKRISASLATVEFQADGKGTRLVFTEQGAFLDGYDNPAAREGGTHELLDAMEAELRR